MKELLYTSAPSGLRPGTSGFCTVAMSEGLPAAVVEFLERLSNTYRPVYMPYDPRAADNPVAISLVRGRPGGQAIAVLSRNAAAGTDHTGRSNNLAHHLVFDPSGPGDGSNPAAVASQSGTFQTRWDNEPRRLPTRSVGGSIGPRGVCRQWEELTGDAGWAATAAAVWTSREGRPLYLIYPAGTNILALLAESISLLPPDRRWDCTFTTYYTGLSQDVTCLVRGVLVGSLLEAEARRGDHVDLMDLLGPAPDGALADRARGRADVEDVIPTVAANVIVPTRRAAMGTTLVASPPVLPDRDDVDEPPPPMPSVKAQLVRESRRAEAHTRAGRGRWGWVTALLFGMLFLLSSAFGAFFGLTQRENRLAAEQQRDEARLEKIETDKRFQGSEQQMQTLKDDLNLALAGRDRLKIEKAKSDIPDSPGPGASDGALAAAQQQLAALRETIKVERDRADKAEEQVKKLDSAKKDPPRQSQLIDSIEQLLRRTEKLPPVQRAVAYYMIAGQAEGAMEQKRKITDKVITGKLEFERKDIPQEDGKTEKHPVFVLKPNLGIGTLPMFDKACHVQGWYISAVDMHGVPTYLPLADSQIREASIPVRYRAEKDQADKKGYWYIDATSLPPEARDDPNLILVLIEKSRPFPGYLLWFKKKA